MPLGRLSVVQHVMRRCLKIRGASRVVLTIPAGDEHMPIVESDAGVVGLEDAEKITIVRVNEMVEETDVLGRFCRVIDILKIKGPIMRVTADCPALDPEICARAITMYKTLGCDFVATRGPSGFDCEVIDAQKLRARGRKRSISDYEREHVTTDFYTRPVPYLDYVDPYKLGGKYSIDTLEDYNRMVRLFAKLGEDFSSVDAFRWGSVHYAK
jgi:spore coat polysaccharide biosynthesis protein SpsF (cytidylyltransferase family)